VSIPTLEDLLATGVSGRGVLVRSDLNVPLDNGTITDDSLSYDIFSQAAQAIRTPLGVDMLAGLPRLDAIPPANSRSCSLAQ